MRPCDDYTPKSRAFQEGYATFECGGSRHECPQEFREADEMDEWIAGFEQAEQVDDERRNGEDQP